MVSRDKTVPLAATTVEYVLYCCGMGCCHRGGVLRLSPPSRQLFLEMRPPDH